MKKLFITLFIALSLILPVQGSADITKFGGFLPCTSDNGTLCTTSRYISTPGITVTTSATYSFLTASLPVFTDASKGLVSVTAVNAFTAIKQAATESATGVAELATVTEAIAGTDTSRIVTAQGVAAATAILKNPLAFAQGINMTYAAAGSSGITVADDADIDITTNNYTLVWKGSLPDWTPSVSSFIFFKRVASAEYWGMYIQSTTGKILLYYAPTGYTPISSVGNSFVDGTEHEIVAVVTREQVGVAGSAVFYVDGYQLGDAFSITAGAPQSMANSDPLYIGGTSAVRSAGTYKHAYVINRALSAAEVLSLYRNGIADADKWGSQTEQTSGTLTVGKKYRINNWITDDDFTNVGGANVDGTEFTATGTTPTTWTNSSTVVQIGATLALENEGIQRDGWKDSSTNGNNASYPASGYSFQRPIRTDCADGLLSVTNVSLGADADTTIYTVPTGKRLVITKAILVVGADAGTSVISIGADGAETDWLPNNTLSALDAANDAAILVPVPNTTPTLIKSYAGGTVIQAKVSSHAGGATNSLSLFGFLY